MIGIISAPVSKQEETDMVHSYVKDNYINWIKLSGEMPVIIPYDITKTNLKIVLQQLDGVLWVGGNIENMKKHTMKQHDTYLSTLHYVYKYAKKEHLPIWGTCLGMQILIMFAKGEKKITQTSFKDDGPRTMSFTGYSRMKQWLSNDLKRSMEKYPCVQHHHIHGYEPTPIEGVRIVSIHNDYINAIEFIDYPFYGVQFHPERPFSMLSLQVSKELSLFFQHECSQS